MTTDLPVAPMMARAERGETGAQRSARRSGRARSFISAARKQSKAVAAGKNARTDQGFIDSVSEDIAE